MWELWLLVGIWGPGCASGSRMDPVDFIGVSSSPHSVAEIPGLRSSVQANVYEEFAQASILVNPVALLSDEGYSKQCFPLQISLDRFDFDPCKFLNESKCPLEPDLHLEAKQTLRNFKENTMAQLMEAKTVVAKQQELLRQFSAKARVSTEGRPGPFQGRRRRRRRWVGRRGGRRRRMGTDPVGMGMVLWDAAALGTSEAALTLVGVNRDAIQDLYAQAAEAAAKLEETEAAQNEHLEITQDVAEALKALESQLRTVGRRMEMLRVIQRMTIPLQQTASEMKMGLEAAVHRGEVTPGLISATELMAQLRQSYGDLGLRGMLFNAYPQLLYRLSRIIVVGAFPRLQQLLGLVCVPMIHSDRLFVLFQHLHAGAFSKDMRFFGRAQIPAFSVLPQHAWSVAAIRYPDMGACWNDGDFLRLCPPIPRTVNGSHSSCSIPPGPGCHWDVQKVQGDFADGRLVGDKWLIATNLKTYREELPRQRHGGLMNPEGSIVKRVEKPVDLYFIPAGGFLHFGRETFGGVPRGSEGKPDFRRTVELELSAEAAARVEAEEFSSLVSTAHNATHVRVRSRSPLRAAPPAPGPTVALAPVAEGAAKSSLAESYFLWGVCGLCIVNLISAVGLWATLCRRRSGSSAGVQLGSYKAGPGTESTTVMRSPEHIPAEPIRSREPSIEYILAPISSTATTADEGFARRHGSPSRGSTPSEPREARDARQRRCDHDHWK